MEFSVGDIVIYVRPGSPFYGTEVEILGPLQFKQTLSDHLSSPSGPGHRYQITHILPKFATSWARPEWLRKKYDGNELVSWDECIWRPEHENISSNG